MNLQEMDTWPLIEADPDKTWFSSDLHLGHLNIITYCNRPFSDPEDQNTKLIEWFNEDVPEDSDLWITGDIALGKIADTLPLVGLLPGRKKAVLGNHDRPWQGHKKTGDWAQKYLDAGFEALYDRVRLDLGGVIVGLCHFPSAGDSHDTDRYSEFRPRLRKGQWLVHGHVHDAWQIRGHEINVGVDVWGYRPVPATKILEIIKAAA